MTRRLYLRQAVLHLMVGEPEFATYVSQYTEYAMAHDEPLPGKRLWWSYPASRSDGEAVVHYMCFAPGEFRTVRPDGPDDVVREAQPSDNPENAPARRIQRCLESWPGIDAIKDEGTSRFIEIGRRIVAQGGCLATETAEATAKEIGTRFLDAQGGAVQDAFERIYDLYRNLDLPGALFTPFACLLQLQKSSGLVLEQSHPLADCGPMVMGCLQPTNPHYESFRPWAVELGNGNYAAAGARLRKALAERCFDRFQTDLFFAAHHFYAALLFVPRGAAPPGYRYSEQLADEGYACAQTGLGLRYGIEEWQRDPLQERLSAILQEENLDAAEDELRRLSKPTQPAYPRHWAEVSLARALIARGGDDLAEGARRLIALGEAMTPEDGAGVELDRIEDGLRVALLARGDTERSKALAARIIGREMVRHSLGSPV